MKILIIDDSSKVGYGGGQRVTETVIGMFADKDDMYFADFSRDSVVYKKNAAKIKAFLPLKTVGTISGGKSSGNIGFLESLIFPFIFILNIIPLLRWYKKAGLPGLVYCTNKKPFLYGVLLKMLYGGRLVFHCHYVSPPSLLSRLFDMAVCRYSDSVICVSEYVTRQFRCKERLQLVYNCVEMANEALLHNEDNRALRIAFVGNLIPLKGVDVFFRVAEDAAASGEPYEFHVFGRNLTDVKMPARVVYRGFLPREEIYRSIDILLVCSKTPESFSLSSVEAQSCGIPVIAPRLGAFAEVIDDGSSGLLYDSYDEINAHIRRLSDKETYERFSMNAVAKSRAFNKAAFVSGMKKAFLMSIS